MKNIYFLKSIPVIIVMLFTLSVNSDANWIKTEQRIEKTSNTQSTPNTQNSKSDSLPEGITQDWLNNITDENGNRIQLATASMPEDPEVDAFQTSNFTGSNAGDEYGNKVSSAGDVNGDGYDDIIIGAPFNDATGLNAGSAYIYYGGISIDTIADVTLSGETSNNWFGRSVSAAGDVNGDGYSDVIVGAYIYNGFTGRAYIYYGGASMNNTADVTMTGEATNNFFGVSVSGAGDVNGDGYSDVIVGAPGVYNSNTGRAYIFYGGATMNNIADVTLTGEAPNNFFGTSVSAAGDVNGDGYSDVIVGAYQYSSATGRAYIYYGGASMNNISDITMTGEAINNEFGFSVSAADDVNGDGYSDVIVGAYKYNSSTGRAYLYYGGAVMNNLADVTMTGETTGNSFGYSLSGAGDVNGDGYSDVIVGAYTYSSNTGRAYIFLGAASMNNVSDLRINGETTNNYFGYSVSEAGDVNGDGYSDVIVGASGYNSNIGKAYLYLYGMTGTFFADLTLTGEDHTNYFGLSVSEAGDVNGDGYSDVVVGAYGYSNYIGRAYIFFGGASMNNVADVTITGETTTNYLGLSVSTAGDVNDDGYSDVIVGAYGYNANTGRAYIFYGGASMNNISDVTMTGEASDNRFGVSVSTADDVNGDGYSDVIVGASSYNGASNGRAYIFYGGASMNNVADVYMTGEASSNRFGTSVSTAADVNGDGYSDVIVGSYGYSSNTGRAYIFLGGASMNNAADLTITGETTNDFFGYSVSEAGDVNGDGYSDVIVGASYNSSVTGRAYIFYGGASMNNTADITMNGEVTYSSFGISVSEAGDVNGDGYSDVIVGASSYSINTGRAYIFYGGAIMNNTADVTMTGDTTNNNFGCSVSTAGDVNGDGNPDLIIGASQHNNNTGKSYLYFTSPPAVFSTINIKVIPEGFYNASINTLNRKDTIRAYLHNNTAPFNVVDSAIAVVHSILYQGTFKFFNAPGGTYYIVIRHRNSIETWSKSGGEPFVIGTPMSYNFTNIVTKAFGNNMKQVDAFPVRFGIYSGDANQDGTIDVIDIVNIFNDANNFVSGYVNTDLTGDDFVDVTDVTIAFNNSNNFVSVIRP